MDWLLVIEVAACVFGVGTIGFIVGYIKGGDAAYTHQAELMADAWIERKSYQVGGKDGQN